MFGLTIGSGDAESVAKMAALDRSQAIIEFALDGTILHANGNFLSAMGYTLAEIKGRHHRLFVDPKEAEGDEYRRFWEDLRQGRHQSAEYKRFAKGGRPIWIRATYNPVLDRTGRPVKVVKFATDVTEEHMRAADFEGQIAAIERSQAVIEFDLSGDILEANANFRAAMGYSRDEIVGRHHSIFVEPEYRESAEYRSFWDRLRHGEFQSGEFRRLGKGGREVYIQASYNPILGMDGKPFKVVKIACDITAMVQARLRNQRAREAIEGGLGGIDSAVGEAASQAAAAAGASSQTTANVQAVAAGAEQLDASVGEIAQSMARSRAESDTAHARAISVDADTRRLTQAAQAMSGIVSLIQNIAGQINLLALNATIESARAGEAGRGFAVVATEVKSLARQAAEATEKITREIDGIQNVAEEVASGLGSIRQSIETVRDCVTSTAGAVEEQTAVTRDISSNMQTAAKAVQHIADSVAAIAQATEKANRSTREVRDASAAFSD